MKKRMVSYDEDTYKVRSNTITIPDFTHMDRWAVLIWLNRHTYARGYSTKQPNLLQGMGGAITIKS